MLDREIGGSICRRGRRYYAGPMAVGTADSVEAPSCFVGDERVGDVHTHGRNGNRGGPSGPDVTFANSPANSRVVFYLIDPVDNMFTYQGPNAKDPSPFR
jgi:hypothetical protein